MNEEIHMINEPLLTEEGFVNQAAVNELESAIRNMPPSYERLADNSEWTQKRWTFLTDITGALTKYAVSQSPYACPDNLETVVKFLDACLSRKFNEMEHVGEPGMVEVSLCDINKWLHEILMPLPQIKDWNTPKDGDPRGMRFVSRCGSDASGPDNDFIDLDALFHNVCLDIRQERRASDDFERRYEKEQLESKEQ